MRRVQLRGKQRSRAVRAQREQHHIARADRRMPRPRDGVLRALALAIAIVTCPTVASAVPQALHVSQAFLSADTSSSRARGRIDVEAVLREEAGGTLATALVAGQTTITVEDGGGFTFTRVIEGCRSRFAATRIRCRSADGALRATFKQSGMLTYQLRLAARRLAADETTLAQPRSPVRITLDQQAGPSRVDVISDCVPSGALAQKCRDLGRPNVVLIITDDQRRDTLQYMPLTQGLVVDQGVEFTNAYVTTPLCCPSRASTLTGQYVHRHGVLSNFFPTGGAPKFVGPDASTFATWLHGEGYRTGIYGKYLNDYRRQCPPYTASCYVAPGWDEWHVFVQQKYYGYQLVENGQINAFGGAAADYSTDVLTAKAVDFIRTAHGQPFLLYVGYHAPHQEDFIFAVPAPRHLDTYLDLPAWRPPSYDEDDITDKPAWTSLLPRAGSGGFFSRGAFTDVMRHTQVQSLQAVDEGIANLIAALDATGQLDNTLIVFTSDNGYLWGEHRVFSAKGWLYEESLRVPLAIRYPPLTGSPRSEPRFALNIDLAPTFAALAGAAPGSPVDGASLVPLLQNTASGWRTDFLFEAWGSLAGAFPTYVGVRGEQFKYCTYPEAGVAELYDLVNDPYELDNRASDPTYQSTVAAMQLRLDEYLSAP